MKYDFEFEDNVIDALIKLKFDAYKDLFGQDADENRGEVRWFIDNLEIKAIDRNGKDVTNELDDNDLDRIESKAFERIMS